MDSSGRVLTFPHASRTDQQLLHTVLDNMSQAVLLFDSEQRLVICNPRYLEMYGLGADNVRPGCSLRDLLNGRRRAGTFAGDPSDYIARLTGCIRGREIL